MLGLSCSLDTSSFAFHSFVAETIDEINRHAPGAHVVSPRNRFQPRHPWTKYLPSPRERLCASEHILSFFDGIVCVHTSDFGDRAGTPPVGPATPSCVGQ